MKNSDDFRIKILIIAFSDSIHTARWISQLDQEKYDIYLFPSVPFKEVHPLIKNISIFQLQNDTLNHSNRYLQASTSYRVAETCFGHNFSRAITTRFLLKDTKKRILTRAIRKFKPSIVHTMETQQAGYLMSDVRPRVNGFTWVHSTWGIDLHYFQEFEDHQQKLIRLFSKLDTLIAEGNRDVQYAKSLEFKGEAFIIPSVGGGLDFEALDSMESGIPPSERKLIILKGYDGDGRLASVALQGLRKIANRLHGFEVIIYSYSPRLNEMVNEIQKNNEFVLHIKKEIAHKELMELTAASRISITNNLTDGVPNTMLEAMALGTFPIQSNTAITDEWIKDGFNGILTQPDSDLQIADSIAKALTDDELVNKAAVYNRNLTRQKLNKADITRLVDHIYTGSVNIPA
jgi:glycosyltransferase involved in cell wall biosynthesis